MNGYLNGIIVTAAVCQIAQMITHNTESYKRIVHILCALVMILTMVQPVRWITKNLSEIRETVTDWLDQKSDETAVHDPLYDIAQAIMEHAAEAYHFSRDGLKVTLVTDDDSGRVKEIQLYPDQCAYADRVRAEKELAEIYGVPVYIYNRRE